jgi:hypothetical protein
MKKIHLTHSKLHRIGFSKVRKYAQKQVCSYCGGQYRRGKNEFNH